MSGKNFGEFVCTILATLLRKLADEILREMMKHCKRESWERDINREKRGENI